MALSRVVSEIFNVQNPGQGHWIKVNRRHWKWYHSIDWVWLWFPTSVL